MLNPDEIDVTELVTDVTELVKRSPVLARLIEEVRTEPNPASAYNRMHNRHNRSMPRPRPLPPRPEPTPEQGRCTKSPGCSRLLVQLGGFFSAFLLCTTGG